MHFNLIMGTVNNKVVKKVKKENNLKPKAETNKTTAKKPSTKKKVMYHKTDIS